MRLEIVSSFMVVISLTTYLMKGTENPVAHAAPVEILALPSQSTDDKNALVAMDDELVRQEVRRLAMESVEFGQLPESDQEWIVQKTALNFFIGRTAFNDLPQQVGELTALRKLTESERENAL